MPRFRKSKLPVDTPDSTPTPPTELIKQLTSRRDSRALVVSSTAIALSIGSAFYGTRDTPGGGATVRGTDSGWETAYDAVRMAVEITKEASDMFPPLKAALGAVSVLIKNCDQTSDNAEKVKEVERRAQSLSTVLAAPVGEDDYAEKGRRVELRRKLEGVIAKLEPLSDQRALVRFLRNVDNSKTLGGFTQELADAITDYQVSVQQGMYERGREIHGDTRNIRSVTRAIRNVTRNLLDNTRDILEAADIGILAKLEPVRNAGYQAGHHDKCLPGTRESVLRDIVFWAKNPLGQNVFWLNGLAGTGKSTIAQSFSDIIANDGFLGASFFCSRDYLNRRELKNIFPTLAHQLACRYPRFRSHVVTNIKKDPTLTHASLISQLENLLVNPLSGKGISCVIVIDALDECIDDQPASAILSVLGRFAKQLPLVKFFITGRPEPRIRTGFRLPLLEPLTQIFLLHEVELSNVDNDIRLYLTQKLSAIARRRSDIDLPNLWPRDNEIIALVEKSSGLFIFASTLVRFIESEHHKPDERLQLVLSETSSTRHEGRTGVDSLYSQVLSHAFSDVREPAVFVDLRRVLGAIVLAFVPLSQRELSKLLGISTSTISTALRHLHSVILVPADKTTKIRIFHKSFPDFLQDHTRCTDPRFHVDSEAHHRDMVLSCLELVKKLKKNPCSLPPFMMNRDVLDLPQLLEDKVGGTTQYACSYWARHLALTPTSGGHVPRVIASVAKMLEIPAPWIEIMSLEDRLEDVIHSMYGLQAWLDNVKPIIRRQADTARHKAEFTREEAKDARHKAEIAKHRAGATGRYVGTTSREDDEAVRKAEVAKTASIQAAAFGNAVDTITISLSLVMDCLRLSMHFFYPIQQCAQQIYHTALPLSPISSQLRKSYLQSVADNRLSHVTAFLGAPDAWGLRLRTIDIKSRQLTCIATPAQGIIVACEDIVDIYDAVTFVLRQSLRAPETVTKIQGTSDGSILFFAHSSSVTMWDVQTGGLTYTFTTQSEITDIAVSTGGHIACGSSDGLVTLWNIYTKEKGEGFGDGQPIVAICWLSPREFGVATQCSVYVRDISVGKTSGRTSIPGRVWRMVCLPSGGELLVGASQPGKGAGQELSSFEIVRRIGELIWVRFRKEVILKQRPRMYPGLLLRPTLVGEEIVCITRPSGVQSFHAKSHDLTSNPPLLNAVTSVAVSLKRNLVAQTEDSIQIFTLDVLKQGGDRNQERVSHVYPLGEKHIICRLQPNSYPTVFELGTLRKLHPNNDTWPLRSLPTNKPPRVRASFSRGLVAEFGISAVQNVWRSGAPLPEWTEAANEDVPLSGLSPDCTQIVTFYGSPRWELCLKRAKDGAALAKLPLERNGFGTGRVYDVAFDSNTRFHLKIDGPGQHFQVPYDIIPSPSRRYSPTITKRKPMPLSEPREAPPYTLDANCEWVVDAESRKICWVSPGNVRRGNGGHFWAGLSLVMVGDDGVVRKLSFREPDS